MKWSKLKKNIESRFAPSVRGKVHLHTTQYGCQCGRAWITFKGKEIANFETILNLWRVHQLREPTNEFGHVKVDSHSRKTGEVMTRGEFSRWDLHTACWDFMSMSLENALTSENPLIQGLAFLDQRLGKKRAAALDIENIHPLAKALLDIRISEDAAEIESRKRTVAIGATDTQST